VVKAVLAQFRRYDGVLTGRVLLYRIGVMSERRSRART
jgi:hypothetical protein